MIANVTYIYPHTFAICTLGDADLQATLAPHLQAMEGFAELIVLPLTTENLGIEQIIEFTLSQPQLNTILLCGKDAKQAVGWLPGASLLALQQHGLGPGDEHRINHAPGKRPLLKNLTREAIEHFRNQVTLVDCIGEQHLETITTWANEQAALPQPKAPTAFTGTLKQDAVEPTIVTADGSITSDPAGYVVIELDPDSDNPLLCHHYTPQGQHTTTLAATSAKAIYMGLIERNLVFRLDHAAYLGRELTRAETALHHNHPYEQDAAISLSTAAN